MTGGLSPREGFNLNPAQIRCRQVHQSRNRNRFRIRFQFRNRFHFQRQRRCQARFERPSRVSRWKAKGGQYSNGTGNLIEHSGAVQRDEQPCEAVDDFDPRQTTAQPSWLRGRVDRLVLELSGRQAGLTGLPIILSSAIRMVSRRSPSSAPAIPPMTRSMPLHQFR